MDIPSPEHENSGPRRRAELSGSIYALLFLLIATFIVNPRVLSIYLERLVPRHQVSRYGYLGFSETGSAVLVLVELILVLCCYRLGPLRMTLREMGLSFVTPKFEELGWGLLAGVLGYAASLPIVFTIPPDSGPTELIIDHFYHWQIAPLILLYAVLLPVTSELVHRGIIFNAFLQSSGLVSATLLSAVVFALVWPVFGWIIGLLLGIVTALLYRRFRNVIPAIVANILFSLACAATLIYRRLCGG